MASDLNQVNIDGRLVEAPKIKLLDGGMRVATMRIASNRYYKGREDPEWKEKTSYIDVKAWNTIADAVADMRKGEPVHIEGSLGQEQWTDAEGKQHNMVLIEANKVEPRELNREKAASRNQEAGVEL
jgi:single-strand DNA-binding protein